MMKSNKIFKNIIVDLLIFILGIDSFAAVVSDNDGSAFITKAEYDSLKNDFQSQIDQYNTSIDSKIDSAIVAYLSGIKVTKTTELKVLYPNPDGNYSNVKWTSSTSYSYDTVENKYWHFYCDFEQNNADWWSKYLYQYGDDRKYNTLYYDATTETYLFKNIQFNLNVWLRFMRFINDWETSYGGNKSDTRYMISAGTVRWGLDFWPTELYENKHYKKETKNGTSYGYSCMYYPTVAVENQTTNNYIIAPLSTATTYVYIPGKELKGDNGSWMNDTSNFVLVSDIWLHTDISDFHLYRDMLVNKNETIVNRTTNELKLNWLLNYDTNKLPISNGLILAKSVSDADKVKLSMICSHEGTVDIAFYNTNTKSYILEDTFEVAIGSNALTIDAGIKKNDSIYIVYKPSDTGALGYLNDISVSVEKND